MSNKDAPDVRAKPPGVMGVIWVLIAAGAALVVLFFFTGGL